MWLFLKYNCNDFDFPLWFIYAYLELNELDKIYVCEFHHLIPE